MEIYLLQPFYVKKVFVNIDILIKNNFSEGPYRMKKNLNAGLTLKAWNKAKVKLKRFGKKIAHKVVSKMDDDSQKVAKLWGERAKISPENRECHWTDSSIIKQYYIHPTISGNKDNNWFIWVKDNFFSKPIKRALSLGCGDGCLERHGAYINVFKECDAFDISPEAIDIAKRKAEELGISERINYDVRNIDNIKLKRQYYDVVFCAMSLHHFENLEHVLSEIEDSLKADGLFIINEYVGPNRFQWTDKQLEIANNIFSLLADKYRFDPTTNNIKHSVQRVPIDHMLATDPSEAVRSAEIIPLIEKRFEILKRIDYGGTLINPVLDNIIVNFDENKPEDMSILKLIFYIEKLLIQENILENNFSLIISKKRSFIAKFC